jgi:anti-anti-sigma regulatory factor
MAAGGFSVPAYLDESEALSLIRLEGDVNIAAAVEMKSLLLKALLSGKDLHVRLDNVTEVDVTTLQMLYAAEQDAAKLGIRFILDGRIPNDISVATDDAGFKKFPVPQDAK